MVENALSTVLLIGYLGIIILTIASIWKVFKKANQPGWAAIVPIFNTYIMLKISDNPGWFLLLMVIPVINLYPLAKMYSGMARAFGKGIGWAIGLWILPFVFFPLLAFSSASYTGHGGGSAGGQPVA